MTPLIRSRYSCTRITGGLVSPTGRRCFVCTRKDANFTSVPNLSIRAAACVHNSGLTTVIQRGVRSVIAGLQMMSYMPAVYPVPKTPCQSDESSYAQQIASKPSGQAAGQKLLSLLQLISDAEGPFG